MVKTKPLFTCVHLNESINHMLGHGIEIKSLHLDTDSGVETSRWKIQVKILKESQRQSGMSSKTTIMHLKAPESI